MREFEVYGLFAGFLVGFILALVLGWAGAGTLVSVLAIVIVAGLFALFAVPEVYRDFALPSETSFIGSMCLWMIFNGFAVGFFWYIVIMVVCLMVSLFFVVIAISDLHIRRY